MQAVVVGDVDPRAHVLGFAAVGDGDAHLRRFGHGLRGHRQRRQDHHVAAGAPADLIGEGDLHARLAQAGVGEDGRTASAQRPTHQVALHRKQRIGQGERGFKACRRNGLQLAGDEVLVAHGFLQVERCRAAGAAGVI
ncbi:hypothetical protein D9M70_582140 [compost metagenome]